MWNRVTSTIRDSSEASEKDGGTSFAIIARDRLVALAKAMALTVVAEGVENPAQLEFLRAQGCELWQGYLCCPPVQASEVRAVLGRRSGGALKRLPTPSEISTVRH